MHKYKKAGRQLKHLLGTIFVSYPSHFVHITIDLDKKFILTKDPSGINELMQASVSKIHMFVAKAIGIGYQFVINEKKEEEVYFGQADMQSEKFVEKLLRHYKEIKISHHIHSLT
jgi:hypothetical protein